MGCSAYRPRRNPNQNPNPTQTPSPHSTYHFAKYPLHYKEKTDNFKVRRLHYIIMKKTKNFNISPRVHPILESPAFSNFCLFRGLGPLFTKKSKISTISPKSPYTIDGLKSTASPGFRQDLSGIGNKDLIRIPHSAIRSTEASSGSRTQTAVIESAVR